MGEFLSKAQEQLIVLRLLRLKVVLVVLGTFCAAWQTAMAQSKWTQLDGDEKFYTGCCIAGLVIGNVVAFLDKTAGTVAKGKLPIDGLDENTKIINKNEIPAP